MVAIDFERKAFNPFLNRAVELESPTMVTFWSNGTVVTVVCLPNPTRPTTVSRVWRML